MPRMIQQINQTNAILSNVLGMSDSNRTATRSMLHNRFMFIADKGYTADEVCDEINKNYSCNLTDVNIGIADLYIQGVIKPTKESRQGVVFKLWCYVDDKDLT